MGHKSNALPIGKIVDGSAVCADPEWILSEVFVRALDVLSAVFSAGTPRDATPRRGTGEHTNTHTQIDAYTHTDLGTPGCTGVPKCTLLDAHVP